MVLDVSAVMILGVQSYKMILQVQEALYTSILKAGMTSEENWVFPEKQAWSAATHLEATDYTYIQKNEAFHSPELSGENLKGRITCIIKIYMILNTCVHAHVVKVECSKRRLMVGS